MTNKEIELKRFKEIMLKECYITPIASEAMWNHLSEDERFALIRAAQSDGFDFCVSSFQDVVKALGRLAMQLPKPLDESTPTSEDTDARQSMETT